MGASLWTLALLSDVYMMMPYTTRVFKNPSVQTCLNHLPLYGKDRQHKVLLAWKLAGHHRLKGWPSFWATVSHIRCRQSEAWNVMLECFLINDSCTGNVMGMMAYHTSKTHVSVCKCHSPGLREPLNNSVALNRTVQGHWFAVFLSKLVSLAWSSVKGIVM